MRLTRYGSCEWITAGVACATVGLIAAYLGWWWAGCIECDRLGGDRMLLSGSAWSQARFQMKNPTS